MPLGGKLGTSNPYWPLEEFFNRLLAEWSLGLATIDDSVPYLFIFAVKVVLLAIGAQFIYYAWKVERYRVYQEEQRILAGGNGVGAIIGKGRLKQDRHMLREAWFVTILAIVSIATPPTVRPSLTFAGTFFIVVFLAWAWSGMQAAKAIHRTNQAVEAYIDARSAGAASQDDLPWDDRESTRLRS